MRFPKTIYVRSEKDSNSDVYLLASAEPAGENGESVGIYQLVSVKKRRIVESLV